MIQSSLTCHTVDTKNMGRVVRKPVNTNPGLKVNRSMYFYCTRTFFAAYVLCSLRLFKFKTEGQKKKQKTSPQSYKIEIKIPTKPGLA